MAQFKCTVAILPKSTLILAGDLPLADKFESTHAIQNEEVKTLISQPLWKKEEPKKKAKAEEVKA